MITCNNCNEEYDKKLKKCPNCNYSTKKNLKELNIKKESPTKYFLLLIPLIIILGIIFYFNYDNNQSNGRNIKENQLKIVAETINIRKENNENSTSLGEVHKGEIYTILDNEEEWYKIKTNTGITGWIYGGSNYIYLYQTIDKPKEEENIDKEYAINNLKDYLDDNYEIKNNIYYKEIDNKKISIDLNNTIYKIKNNYEITYNYSLREMTYVENNNSYYITIKYNTKTKEKQYESNRLDEAYANNIIETILEKEYQEWLNLLKELNITEEELKKED